MINLSSLFHEKLHVCVDDKSLKIVQVKTLSDKRTIAGVYYKKIENLSSESISQEIKNGIASLKSSARSVSVVLPSKFAITKNIEVPSLDKEEIENIIRLQAVRHTPYSREEVIVGHINLERILERYTKVLLVIVSNENIRNRTGIFELAGYEIESVHLSSDVLVRLVNWIRPFSLSESPSGLVYVDSDYTDLIIVHNAKPYFIRSIPLGSEHLKQDPSGTVRKLVEEFKKTCEAYQNEDQGTAVKLFLVAGLGGSGQTDLMKSIKNEFGVEAEVVSLTEKLPFTTDGKSMADMQTPVSFLDVFADGLIQDASTIDLLPDDLKVRKSFREKGKEIFTATIFVIIILALMVGVSLTKIYFRQSYLKEITQNFEAKQKEAVELGAISDVTRVVKDFKARRGVAFKVLDEFQKVLPPDMYLNEISLTEDGRISIKGTSALMSTVFSFVTELEKISFFNNVTSDYTKSRKEKDKDVSDFGLSASLKESSSHGG